jgi:hypothetical protein
MEGRALILSYPGDLTIFILERDGRMAMQSASVEEGYFIPLLFGFYHYSYRPLPSICVLFTLREHIDYGFALFQNHSPDYLEIHQS